MMKEKMFKSVSFTRRGNVYSNRIGLIRMDIHSISAWRTI
jgi:hypothetical protein